MLDVNGVLFISTTPTKSHGMQSFICDAVSTLKVYKSIVHARLYGVRSWICSVHEITFAYSSRCSLLCAFLLKFQYCL